MTITNQAISAYLQQNQARFLDELKDVLRIPSISNDPAHRGDIGQAAQWMADRLRQAGLTGVEVIPTEGHPLVYGENLSAGPQAPTVLIYGHYDVQPPDPLADWRTPPFEPRVAGENLFARGATDMKGQVMACVAAAEAVLQAGNARVNIKFLIEGEEEIGSSHFQQVLEQRQAQLACDVVLNPDAGGMPNPQTPVIVYALRGGAGVQLAIYGPDTDVHSGLFGGIVHNPIHVLSNLIAGLQDVHGRITLPGFYDQVRPLEAQERAELARLPVSEEYYRSQAGVPALWGDPDYSPVERVGARPSFDVLKIEGGQPKSAIPARATASLAFRLVPDQDPQRVLQLLEDYIARHVPPTVRWEILSRRGAPAVLTNRDSEATRAMQHSLAKAFGKPAVFQRIGGSIPAVLMFQQVLGVDSLLTGFSLVDDSLHGPNEKIHLPTFNNGIAAVADFFASYS